MVRAVAVVILVGAFWVPSRYAEARDKATTEASETAAVPVDRPPAILPRLPQPPRGNSTVVGGILRTVDPVRDRLVVMVSGPHPMKMKILFDERTEVYRDGMKVSTRDLQPDAHASIETVLDGTQVFARTIHVLSQSPEGEYQGQILGFNSATRELTLTSVLAHEPLRLRVPPETPILRQAGASGRMATENSTDLTKGTLVAVTFQSGNEGRGTASQIRILAAPGSNFVFDGDVSFLDVHDQLLVLLDSIDGQTYRVAFDPARFPVSTKLREGTHVRVTALFDGTGYVANAISVQ